MPSITPLRTIAVLSGVSLALLAMPAFAGATGGLMQGTAPTKGAGVIIVGKTHLASVTSPTVLNDEGTVQAVSYTHLTLPTKRIV